MTTEDEMDLGQAFEYIVGLAERAAAGDEAAASALAVLNARQIQRNENLKLWIQLKQLGQEPPESSPKGPTQ